MTMTSAFVLCGLLLLRCCPDVASLKREEIHRLAEERKPTLPVFVKQHKVGGTTVATLMDCVSVKKQPLRAQVARWGKGLSRRECPTTVFNGWLGPWSHNAMKHYRTSGTALFSKCLPNDEKNSGKRKKKEKERGPRKPRDMTTRMLYGFAPRVTYNVRLLTVIRHPIERLFSALAFFA